MFLAHFKGEKILNNVATQSDFENFVDTPLFPPLRHLTIVE
jgi:hypothetical protein